MTLSQLSKWENLERFHPAPWYLDQNNAAGVCVKDNRGEIVFYEDFGSFPDEMKSGQREQIAGGAVALALFLVAFSEKPFGA